jgi:hypothetical protein
MFDLLAACLHSDAAVSKTPVQRDWEQREFAEKISLNVMKIADFLNKFGALFALCCAHISLLKTHQRSTAWPRSTRSS